MSACSLQKTHSRAHVLVYSTPEEMYENVAAAFSMFTSKIIIIKM